MTSMAWRRAARLLGTTGLVLALTGCAWLAVSTAPNKVAQPPSEQALALKPGFWSALHGGQYDQIDTLVELHAREVARSPADALTIAHLGWLHAWRIAERTRQAPQGRVIEDALLARRLFDEAARLDPAEARYAGFAASFAMAEGQILGDVKLQREGYFRMRHAVSMWPEFNLFTSGYTMSTGDVKGDAFREGLAQQWETLDRCFGERVSRQQPRLAPYLGLATREGPKRACWNSWIAPHNWEGFFLNFGDMLARTGDLDNARTMYEAARLSPDHAQWPWRDVLTARLERLRELPDLLNRKAEHEPLWVPMGRSAFSCSACHQATGGIPIDPRAAPRP